MRRVTHGFALLEVLVALTLLAVGIVGVLAAALAALDVEKDSAMRYRAGLILQAKLAEAFLDPYRGASIEGRSDDDQFTWSIRCTPWTRASAKAGAGPDSSSQLHVVCVEVRWPAARGSQGSQWIRAHQLASVPANAGETP